MKHVIVVLIFSVLFGCVQYKTTIYSGTNIVFECDYETYHRNGSDFYFYEYDYVMSIDNKLYVKITNEITRIETRRK